MSADDEPRPSALLSAALLAAFMAAFAADVFEDSHVGISARHFIVEILVTGLAVAQGVVLWIQVRRARRRAASLGRDLEKARAEAASWRAEASSALDGMRRAINEQLGRWGLTEAERDVALLLLRGLSHKDVAQLRSTSERTVRQQSLAIYRKSGLGGRSELAAYFLSDLLAPPGSAAAELTAATTR